MTDSSFMDGSILVVAFEGWNDAGEAASSSARTLRDQFGLVPLRSLDPEAYFDYQFNRPTSSYDETGKRVLNWPEVVLWGPPDGAPGVHVLLGAEPSRAWKTFADEVMDAVEDAEITGIVFLGAMLADVPHTRPISIHVTSDSPEVREVFDLERSSYEGPTGILAVLAVEAERIGIPSLSIWASVPHYVHNAPAPKATLALIQRLEEFVPIEIERGELVEESAAWESGIDQLAGEDDEMAAYIAQLERARDTVDAPEASGDAIAEEFERYLRRRDRPSDGPPSVG